MAKERRYSKVDPESKTQQHFKQAADINHIMARGRQTGVIQGPGTPSGQKMRYMHLTGQTYHDMLIQVQQAQGAFAGLPARVRKRFSNNPENLLTFLEDPKNVREAVKLGIIEETSISPELKAQLDLVEEAEQKDMEAFREWQRNNRASSRGPQEDGDPFERDARGSKADDESQPGYKKKPRK